ncbi:MAG TPA: hypothetical protein QF900_05330 [Arenicellales bacterium]|nr:hypothetical protein [Arenicellales bacterium]HJL66230.1 hypothetical protein [Arenicellales bacterium]
MRKSTQADFTIGVVELALHWFRVVIVSRFTVFNQFRQGLAGHRHFFGPVTAAAAG